MGSGHFFVAADSVGMAGGNHIETHPRKIVHENDVVWIRAVRALESGVQERDLHRSTLIFQRFEGLLATRAHCGLDTSFLVCGEIGEMAGRRPDAHTRP